MMKHTSPSYFSKVSGPILKKLQASWIDIRYVSRDENMTVVPLDDLRVFSTIFIVTISHTLALL